MNSGSEDIYRYLSKNKDKTINPETEGEKLINHQKDLINARETDLHYCPQHKKDSKYNKKLAKNQAWAAKSSQFSNFWNSDHCNQYLMDLYFSRQHFSNSLGQQD